MARRSLSYAMGGRRSLEEDKEISLKGLSNPSCAKHNKVAKMNKGHQVKINSRKYFFLH